MSLTIGDVLVKVLADDVDFQKDVDKKATAAGKKAGKTIGEQLGLNLKTAIVGAGIGTAFSMAIKSGAVFEDQLRTINTVAHLTDAGLAEVGDGIQELARETGKSTDDLTAGFYDLVSAGVAPAKAMAVLRDSAILATGALGTTGEAVDLVTSALNAYGLGAENSTRVTDIFAQAVADGKVTAAELATSIANIAPIAAAAGIRLEEVAAGYALMTAKGTPAAQAATQMRAAISALITPNVQLAEASKKVGINFAELAKEKGLAVALERLRQAVGGSDEAFAKALGSVEALQYALAVTGDNSAAAATELGKIEGGANKGGVALDQYTEKSKSSVEQSKRLQQWIATLVQDFGQLGSGVAPVILGLGQVGQAISGVAGVATALGAKKLLPGFIGIFKDLATDTGVLRAAATAGAAQGAAVAGGEAAGGLLGSLARTLKGKAGIAFVVGAAIAGAAIAGSETEKAGGSSGEIIGNAILLGLGAAIAAKGATVIGGAIVSALVGLGVGAFAGVAAIGAGGFAIIKGIGDAFWNAIGGMNWNETRQKAIDKLKAETDAAFAEVFPGVARGIQEASAPFDEAGYDLGKAVGAGALRAIQTDAAWTEASIAIGDREQANAQVRVDAAKAMAASRLAAVVAGVKGIDQTVKDSFAAAAAAADAGGDSLAAGLVSAAEAATSGIADVNAALLGLGKPKTFEQRMAEFTTALGAAKLRMIQALKAGDIPNAILAAEQMAIVQGRIDGLNTTVDAGMSGITSILTNAGVKVPAIFGRMWIDANGKTHVGVEKTVAETERMRREALAKTNAMRLGVVEDARQGSASVPAAFRAQVRPAGLAAEAEANAAKGPFGVTWQNAFSTYADHAAGGLVSTFRGYADDAADASALVAKGLRKHLAFSAPPPGPLNSIRSWMPHMFDHLIGGGRQQLGRLAAFSEQVAAAMVFERPAFAMADVAGMLAPLRQSLAVSGEATIHHTFGEIRVRADGDLSPAAAGALGRGIGAGLIDAEAMLRAKRTAGTLPVKRR